MNAIYSSICIVPILLLMCIKSACLRSLQLGRQPGSLRLQREYEAPEISMHYVSPHWFKIECTIPKSSSEFKVFISCPALASPCYENCLPIQSCSKDDSSETICLPDQLAVNCTEAIEGSERKVMSLWIDKRDTRLHGSWFCTSQGVKSSVVKVVQESEETPILAPTPNSSGGSPSPNDVEISQTEDLKETFVREEEKKKSPFYAITLRRKKYKDDQKYLGDMICLPTQMSRTQSGLWENDVYPSTLIDTLQEPYSYKNNAIKVQRFGTFGPTSVALDHSHLHSGDEFADMAFPQYFNTVQPDQLWRARSAIAFSPGNLSTTNRRTSNFNTDASSLNQVNLHNDNPPLPPPPHLVINSLTQGSEEHKRLTMANSKLIPTTNAVYDDVATSSTITVISRDAKKPGLQLDPHLPSLMEFDRPI